MAMLCVRNTHLETIHVGKVPVTRTGDWSDVTVVDANGNRIPWTEVSHISDIEMRDLMRDIVNRLYTFHLCADDPGLQAEIERWKTVAGKWDEPEVDERMIASEFRPGARFGLVLQSRSFRGHETGSSLSRSIAPQ